jgi:hypothetical protein
VQLAAQNHRYIRVFTGFWNYNFDPKELFLFTMTKVKFGYGNTALCKLIFGSHASWWSYGYPWILEYLDRRYDRTISHKKLRDYVDKFPLFYQAINKFVQKTSVHHFHNGKAVERQGLSFLPWSIFGFIDCSINWISWPMSGPDGDYVGAPRRPLGNVAQRAVYTGYKKCYGLKVVTVLLPNGISTLFGPALARIHDVGGVLQLSGLDDFLVEIQQGKPEVYCAFGDSTYNARYLQCI